LRVIENTKLTQINQIQNIQIEKREETHSYKEAASPAYMEAAASYVHEQGGGKVTNFGGKHSKPNSKGKPTFTGGSSLFLSL